MSPLSSQKNRRKARKNRTEQISADDALPSARRAVLVPTGPRRISRRGSDAGPCPGHGLVLRREVDGRRRRRGGEVRVEARRYKDGPAARADGGRVRRRDGHVVLRVERAWDRASQVRQRDVGRGYFDVRVARRVGYERVDVRERPAARSAEAVFGEKGWDLLVWVAAAERAESPSWPLRPLRWRAKSSACSRSSRLCREHFQGQRLRVARRGCGC